MNEPTDIFNHEYHLTAVAEDKHLSGLHPTNFACVECHAPGNPKTSAGAKDCMECHKEDMFPAGKPTENCDLMVANPFREAVHRTCIECHRKEAARVERPHLGDCQTCHTSLRPKSTESVKVVHLVSSESRSAP